MTPVRTHSMTRITSTAMIAAVLSVASLADAEAWTRSGGVTGPNGTSTVTASGDCTDYTCSRSVKRTGPNGRSASRQGSVSCDPSTGVCSGKLTTTGANGDTIVRQGTISR